MNATTQIASAALTATGVSQRDRIAALISEISADAVRLSNNGKVLVYAKYEALTDGFSLRISATAGHGRCDQQCHQQLFAEFVSLCGYSEDPTGVHSAERDAITTLNNWLGYLRQLEQQLAA